ncbi:MAG TPA: hypothetical protein DCQ93_01630 [Bacteroidetes bacterium]|nr:hypothetical protein [Bacteroidota bacterium]
MNDPGSVFNPELVIMYGGITILCITIFSETGLFFCFFFPGDSLVFTAGVLTETGILPYPWWLAALLMIASAIIGNMVGYWFGRRTGSLLMTRRDSIFFRKEYVTAAENFYGRYGGMALVLGRFLPVIRTFAPIVAGVIKLPFRRFFFYSSIGAALWVVPLTLAGNLLGRIQFVKDYLGYIIIAMVIGITSPVLIRLMKENRKAKKKNEKIN